MKKFCIDSLLESAEEFIEVLKRPFVRKKIKGALESAIDNAREDIVTANIEILNLRKQLVLPNSNKDHYGDTLQAIAEQRAGIDKIDRVIGYLKAEEKELFNKAVEKVDPRTE